MGRNPPNKRTDVRKASVLVGVASLPICIFSLLAFATASTSESLNDQMPAIYLIGASKMTIGESEIATVFGYDKCPPDAFTQHASSCLKVSSKQSIDVRLILNSGAVIKETWSVDSNIQGLTLVRPNGFQVEPAVVLRIKPIGLNRHR